MVLLYRFVGKKKEKSNQIFGGGTIPQSNCSPILLHPNTCFAMIDTFIPTKFFVEFAVLNPGFKCLHFYLQSS